MEMVEIMSVVRSGRVYGVGYMRTGLGGLADLDCS